MHIFHVATEADWAAAQPSGTYTTSTRGRTLEQEGFIHASRREQVDPVGDDTFPHVYGPINASAVVQAEPFPN